MYKSLLYSSTTTHTQDTNYRYNLITEHTYIIYIKQAVVVHGATTGSATAGNRWITIHYVKLLGLQLQEKGKPK